MAAGDGLRVQHNGVGATAIRVLLAIQTGDDQAQPLIFSRVDGRDDVEQVALCVYLREKLGSSDWAGCAAQPLTVSPVFQLPELYAKLCIGPGRT